MATVVVLLCSTVPVSSMSRPAALSGSSVCSGRISLTAPTSVVLPAPKPPAMRIFRAMWLEGPESIDHFPEDPFVGQVGQGGRAGHPDAAGLQQVRQDDPDHAQR